MNHYDMYYLTSISDGNSQIIKIIDPAGIELAFLRGIRELGIVHFKTFQKMWVLVGPLMICVLALKRLADYRRNEKLRRK